MKGDCKWSGIAVVDQKLFCAPHSASGILVIDTDTEEFHTIECGVTGNTKWFGIAVVDRNLYCSPFHISVVLVIDVDTEEVHTIKCGGSGHNQKWHGIAAVDGKVFCAPRDESTVLVVDNPERCLNFLGLRRDVGQLNLEGVKTRGKDKEEDALLSSAELSVELDNSVD